MATHTSKQWATKGRADGLAAKEIVEVERLPNEIVYGKPQCEKCHLLAKMSMPKEWGWEMEMAVEM